ncbi:diguanylate cyclase [bacterium]|nr:MAG: diguanylate cyclase [bacterium]RKZ22579.1 MAG: diguanylate cyclase [bacterium]
MNSRMMIEAFKGGAGGIVSKTISMEPARDRRPTIRKGACRGLYNAETWSELPKERMIEELLRVKKEAGPLIVSIGYTPEQLKELGKLIQREVEPDGIEFSTHYVGRSIQPLLECASALRSAVDLPIWMKVSPTVLEIEELAVKVSPYVDGFVAVNSFGPVLDFDVENPEPLLGSDYGAGWLSGPAIQPIALRIVYQISTVQDKPVIGVGGIEKGKDAVKFIMAGASAVQVCTGAIKKGHKIYGKIASEIEEFLDKHGYSSIEDIKGLYSKRLKQRRLYEKTPAMWIDSEKCTGCKACINMCIHSALYMEKDKAKVRDELCIGCGFCMDWCVYGAMELREEE